jgi:hypothetical protein
VVCSTWNVASFADAKARENRIQYILYSASAGNRVKRFKRSTHLFCDNQKIAAGCGLEVFETG